MVVHRHAERWKPVFWLLVFTLFAIFAVDVLAALDIVDLRHAAVFGPAMQALATLAVAAGLFEMRRAFSASVDRELRLARQRESAYRYDEMTGALNRAAFIGECETKLHERRADSGYFLHIDLDYLKRINDSLGHARGDAALRHLADIARALAPGCAFGRLGGDEFALLMMHRPHGEAMGFANRFLSQLSMTVWHDGQPLNLSASIGVAPIVGEISGFDELVHRADLALYQSKRNGRAQATLFENEMLTDLRYTRLIERELRAAIMLGELELVYQPVLRRDGSMAGCEALVRWRHSLRGMISPAEFIPVAERSVLIDLVGEWVLRQACRDMREFPEMYFSVNFSANQFKRDTVVAMVQSVLAETGIAPPRLVVEITESMAMSHSEDVRERLNALRSLGVKIALDDFGAGFSGFAYLQSFPVDAIKIDRAFVTKLGTSAASNVMVTALVSVAHAAGMHVVAEGVETAEQHRLGAEAGADLFQGYHLARPMGLAAVRERRASKERLAVDGPPVKTLAFPEKPVAAGPGEEANVARRRAG
ncbi:bifunctional diguanylate cyclase/phosphodiesterase [Jiella endophytica]|uniref:Bifunctional diguanylate cyclase/phosphodiesterase n=1 Tax=Jiella endophytica TaxID=2558362 RepID=A0A4Y8RBG5_9HYPH|nr:bifunctional diguanylate cyclase/phosphodiesterase [Jiella endophytica]TFF19153.1 bifunctional diguanylate cyclase/phosphodiesterase [Jiella endophytica]